jgi:hypothetical protein
MKMMNWLYCLPVALSSVMAQSGQLPDTMVTVATNAEGETERNVSSADELLAATRDPSTRRIVVTKDLTALSSVRLTPGQSLTGSGLKTTLRFADDSTGIQLSSNNRVENLDIIASIDKRVIFNDADVDDFGLFDLRNLILTGVVQICATNRVRAGRVEAHNIDIESADARAYTDRPKDYGVEVVNGAFTIWNQQADPSVTITADVTGITAGRPDAPVHGSGILISGASDTGGKVLLRHLETGPIYSDGGIPKGTANRISGGVFTAYGTVVDSVHTKGTVTTYGPNDMVLDNWGVVDRWLSEEKVTSYGPSGIGFVNFGIINSLKLKAPVETFGEGARGFNVYSGTVRSAEFDRIVTRGNGSVGIQIGQPAQPGSCYGDLNTANLDFQRFRCTHAPVPFPYGPVGVVKDAGLADLLLNVNAKSFDGSGHRVDGAPRPVPFSALCVRFGGNLIRCFFKRHSAFLPVLRRAYSSGLHR